MRIIVGLGNPWKQYETTRHNIGFLCLDFLRESWGCSAFTASRHWGRISEGTYDDEKILLLKPETYMNLSGESVGAILRYYHLDPTNDLLVISDDISMEFGKIRYRTEGSAGGHNGLKSLIAHVGKWFKRVKIGVGNDPNIPLDTWVLGWLTHNELHILQKEIFPRVRTLLIEKIH